ncbi:hypothetical protein SUDANB105_00749 [Streptomyces sp. enrichment culture]|uniref:hypothetical protein n=1 Tax=Streptomyces sp. enrichment culture TaxID=1795815 RepID=UPI003F55EDD5
MVRIQELLRVAAQFAGALETVLGRQIAARLEVLVRQLDFLTAEVRQAAEDPGATVAVLPPHRTPAPPRIRPRPVLDTKPPAAPRPTPPRQCAAPNPR